MKCFVRATIARGCGYRNYEQNAEFESLRGILKYDIEEAVMQGEILLLRISLVNRFYVALLPRTVVDPGLQSQPPKIAWNIVLS